MNNNLKKGGDCGCRKIQQGGDCGCSAGLGFPLTGGGPFGKSRREKMQVVEAKQEKLQARQEKKQERREEKQEEAQLILKEKKKELRVEKKEEGQYMLSLAQGNPDAFKTLCSIIPDVPTGTNFSSSASLPFPLNLFKDPLHVRNICNKIKRNPDILTAPIASEVKTSNGSTVQEQINLLHNVAVTGSYGMSSPSYGIGSATSVRPSGGGLFDMFQEEKPNNANILANNGRTVHEHLDELHENLHVPNNIKPNRNNSNVNNNSQIGLFGGRRKTRKTRKSRKVNKARKTRTK